MPPIYLALDFYDRASLHCSSPLLPSCSTPGTLQQFSKISCISELVFYDALQPVIGNTIFKLVFWTPESCWDNVDYIRKTPCLLFGAFSTFLVLFMKNVEKA